MHTNEKECNLATPPPPNACLKFPNFLKTSKFIFHIDCILPFSTSAQSALERHVQTRNLFNYQTCLEPRLNKQSLPDSDTQWVCNLLL